MLNFVWFEEFIELVFAGLNTIKTKTLATTIITTIATAIKMISAVESSFLGAGTTETGGLNVTTWVPHFWQNLAFSSSLTPHLRQ